MLIVAIAETCPSGTVHYARGLLELFARGVRPSTDQS
jgi:hypothetical protein